MHPVLRQMKPFNLQSEETGTSLPEEGEGIARVGGSNPDKHPRVLLKKDASEAYIPTRNLLRDDAGQELELMRDMRFKSGKCITANKKKCISDSDFLVNENTGIAPARAEIEAANLVTAYEQTVKQEANFQKSFNNNVRVLISREEVTIGLMYLWDFVEALLHNPHSKTLTAQLFLIVQHSRDDGIFKESLLSITAPESRWLLDLLNILQTIIVQERTLKVSEKVAAINYSVITLGKYYARKIFKTPFVPLDKEVKIDTFYMRMVIKLLCLSDDLGVYRNEKLQKVVSATRQRELSDIDLMRNLTKVLRGEDPEEKVILDGEVLHDTEDESDDSY